MREKRWTRVVVVVRPPVLIMLLLLWGWLFAASEAPSVGTAAIASCAFLPCRAGSSSPPFPIGGRRTRSHHSSVGHKGECGRRGVARHTTPVQGVDKQRQRTKGGRHPPPPRPRRCSPSTKKACGAGGGGRDVTVAVAAPTSTDVLNERLGRLARDLDPRSSQRAAEMLEGALREYDRPGTGGTNATSDPARCRPDTVSFGAVIHAWAKAGRSARGAAEAESWLRRMERLRTTGGRGYGHLTLHTRMYNDVIGAWARGKDVDSARRAENVLAGMVRASEAGNTLVRPDVVSYTLVMNAWSKSRGGRLAAERAERVLRHASRAAVGTRTLQVDAVMYTAVIAAWANSGESGGAERAENILLHMLRLYREGNNDRVRPDVVTFNAVINAWAKSGERGSARRAEAVLDLMLDFCDDVDSAAAGNGYHPRPDTISFTSVIDAWARSREVGAASRAQRLLERMLRMCSDRGDGGTNLKSGVTHSLKPNTITFNAVINAWAKSADPQKATRAYRLLRQMNDMCQLDGDDGRVKPSVVSYNSVMNACAFCSHGDANKRRDVLRILMKVMAELKESTHCEPNGICYGTFVKGCANLISRGEELDAMVDEIFTQCDDAGLVDARFLECVRYASPTVHRRRISREEADALKIKPNRTHRRTSNSGKRR